MGATSLSRDLAAGPRLGLVQALPVPALIRHDLGSLQAVARAGNRLSYYNDGNRWTYGRYLKMLVVRHNLELRLAWHFNNTAGDPYYALDCREDDYCWYNTNARQEMVAAASRGGRYGPDLRPAGDRGCPGFQRLRT